MAGVFISYRRQDTSGWTGRIYDRLATRLGSNRVFVDIDNIPPGQDFTEVINRTLDGVDALIAVIGRRWLTVADEEGRIRISDPEDYVRREVATALARGALVVPVLVDGASMPAPRELPEDLRPLATRNAVVVTDLHFDHDLNRLADALERIMGVESKTEVKEQERRPDAEPKTCPACGTSNRPDAVFCTTCGRGLRRPDAAAAGRPAVGFQPATFVPTHRVPYGGMQAWSSPNPSLQPIARLATGVELRVDETRGAWARVTGSNGWTGWVDARRLEGMHRAPAPTYVPAAPATTSGYAVASLVLALLVLFGIGSLLAVVFGHKARREIAGSGGRVQGRGLATAGLVIGYIGLGVVIVWILLLMAADPY